MTTATLTSKGQIVTALKGMFGKAGSVVSIEDMQRAIARRCASAKNVATRDVAAKNVRR